MRISDWSSDVCSSDRAARAFGLSEGVVVYRYALKVAILPTVALLGMGFGSAFSGAVFAEIIFSRPGLGKLIYDMVITRNYPVVQGGVMVRSEERRGGKEGGSTFRSGWEPIH